MLIINRVKTGTNYLSTADFKIWAKIDYNDDDELIETLIDSVREIIENYIQFSIVNADIQQITSVREDNKYQLYFGSSRTWPFNDGVVGCMIIFG
jgi:hypothetical protein